MYADRFLRHSVWTHIEDVFAHVVVSGLPLEGLIIALHKEAVTLFICQKQDLILGGRFKQLLSEIPFSCF